MGDFDSTAVSGVEARGYRRGTLATDSWDQYVIPTTDRIVSYRGRANTFRTPGIAGTVGQKVLSIHNAVGSAVLVDVEEIRVDMTATVAKAVTVLPPLIRLHRVTVMPTLGTALGKVAVDSSLTSNASVALLQGAQADGTASATALAATIPAASIITQEFAPRLITGAGYEMFDRSEYLTDNPITLRALEGIVVFLDYVLITQNPATDMWAVGVSWTEYARP